MYKGSHTVGYLSRILKFSGGGGVSDINTLVRTRLGTKKPYPHEVH